VGETCSKCGHDINDTTCDCPGCGHRVREERLVARISILESAIEGWRNETDRLTAVIDNL